MPSYIHQHTAWPDFRWDEAAIGPRLAAVRHRQGRLLGRMESLGLPLREQALVGALTQDAVKSSEIEGEVLDEEQVRSSLARRLGLDTAAAAPADRSVDGVVEMLLDATQNYAAPLTARRLQGWHAALFPTGRSELSPITTGAWRPSAADPMQVVSGVYGRQKVHFEAPAGARLEAEMAAFLAWFESRQALDPVLKAAIAHLWFVTIHPFEDGNGRIARAIGDLALARSEESPQRAYSLSAQIRLQRRQYYAVLEATQRGDLNITAWLVWFLDCLDGAIAGADELFAAILAKARFWKGAEGQPLNPRQREMLNRLLDGFTGKLTTSKWAQLTHTSPDTALRDIADLVERGLLVKEPAGGRSTSYRLPG